MNNNACSHLLQELLGNTVYEMDEKAIRISDISPIFSEPNSPPILRVLGAKAAIVTNKATSAPLHGAGKIYLTGISGEKITLILGRNGSTFSADLPLVKPPTSYRGPTYKRIKNVINKLASIMGSKRLPLVADNFVAKANQVCRPRLGCAKAQHYKPLDHGLDLSILYPKITYPTMLGWVKIRPMRSMTFSTPWLCIGKRGTYANILCLNNLCTINVSRNGSIELIEGEAVYNIGTRCSKTKLYVDYLLGNSYGESEPENIENKKPVLWSLTAAIPMGVERKNNEVELCIWNPYPISKLHEIVFEKHRVLRAAIYSVETDEWEPLEPRYNRVSFGSRPLSLARLKLHLRELPPFLIKR